MTFFRKSFLALMLCVIETTHLSCVTARGPSDEFHETKTSPSAETVIVFLIDGLPYSTLVNAQAAGDIPSLSHFFLASPMKSINRARSIFPTLTFPNITSLLTLSSVEKHSVYGNRVVIDHEIKNFESPFSKGRFNKVLGDHTIFAKLGARGLSTVSLAQFIWSGASVRIPTDLDSGIAYLDQDYKYIDVKTIKALNLLLSDTEPRKWPSFIFVHLVGVDLTSHQFGPGSPKVRDYLSMLDHQLSDVFKILVTQESSRKTISLLTSDHGFDQEITGFVDVENYVYSVNKKIRVLNEGRTVALQFPPDFNIRELNLISSRLSKNTGIALVAFRREDQIFLDSKNLHGVITYQQGVCPKTDYKINLQITEKNRRLIKDETEKKFFCPEAFENPQDYFIFPFIVPNLASYFNTPYHPEAVVMAQSGISFNRSNRGQHGGPTENEVVVPVLLRNASFQDPNKIVPIEDLLKFVVEQPTIHLQNLTQLK